MRLRKFKPQIATLISDFDKKIVWEGYSKKIWCDLTAKPRSNRVFIRSKSRCKEHLGRIITAFEGHELPNEAWNEIGLRDARLNMACRNYTDRISPTYISFFFFKTTSRASWAIFISNRCDGHCRHKLAHMNHLSASHISNIARHFKGLLNI